MLPDGSTKRRWPKGYLGKGHETIGSDILAVTKILKLPEQVLGADEVRKLSDVEMDGWYPIEWLLDLMDKVDAELGQYGLLQMGRRLFALSHEERLVQVARSAADVIYGIDGMYHHANRGSGIGGWKVLRFESGYAELEKTTPHHCVMEQGILSGALAAVKCPGNVSQRQCFRQGAESCIYVISSSLTDERWHGRVASLRAAPSGSSKTAADSGARAPSGSSKIAADSGARAPSGSSKIAADSGARAPSGSSKIADPDRTDPGPPDSLGRMRVAPKDPKR